MSNQNISVQSSGKFCHGCGNAVALSAEICPGCGTRVSLPANEKSSASRGVYIVLALLFGSIGIHNFYAKKYVMGIVELLLPIFTFGIGLMVTIPLAICEAIFVTRDGEGKKLS